MRMLSGLLFVVGNLYAGHGFCSRGVVSSKWYSKQHEDRDCRSKCWMKEQERRKQVQGWNRKRDSKSEYQYQQRPGKRKTEESKSWFHLQKQLARHLQGLKEVKVVELIEHQTNGTLFLSPHQQTLILTHYCRTSLQKQFYYQSFLRFKQHSKLHIQWYNLYLRSKLQQAQHQDISAHVLHEFHTFQQQTPHLHPNKQTYPLFIQSSGNNATKALSLAHKYMQTQTQTQQICSSFYSAVLQVCSRDAIHGFNISQSILQQYPQLASDQNILRYTLQSCQINSLLTNDQKIHLATNLLHTNANRTNRTLFIDQSTWNQTLHIYKTDPTRMLSSMQNDPITHHPYLKVTATHTHWLITSLLALKNDHQSPSSLQQAMQTVQHHKYHWPWTRDTIYAILDQLTSIKEALTFLQSLVGYVPFIQLQDYHYLLCKSNITATDALDILNAIQVTQRNRQYAILPTSRTYTLAITNACQNDIQMACQLLQLASSRNNIPPNVYLYTATIWVAAKYTSSFADTTKSQNLVDTALSLLQQMKHQSIQPNAITYDGVITTMIQQNNFTMARAIFLEMTNTNGDIIEPSHHSCQILVNYILQKYENDTMSQIQEMEKLLFKKGTRLPSNPIVENLIRLYGQVGKYSNAKALFDSLQEPVADASCLCAILYVCSTATPAKWEDAVQMVHCSDIVEGAMGPGKVERKALTYAVIACAREEEWIEGFNLLELYARQNNLDEGKKEPFIEVDAINSIMAAAGRNGRPDVAIQLLNQMKSRYHVEPNQRSYKTAIIACHQAERRQLRSSDKMNNQMFQWWECALSLHRRMKEEGYKLDPQTYTSIISACEAAGQWQRAIGILRTMDTKKNLYCFNAAMSACEKGGAWLEALEIFERMKKYRNIKPNFITFNSLLIALDNADQRELAETIYQEAIRDQLIQPWKQSTNHRGQSIRAMDLHQFSKPMAKIAVRYVIDSLVSSSKPSHNMTKDFVIIVGKGKTGIALLTPVIRNMLMEEYGISSHMDETNPGRIIVTSSSLLEFIQKSCWVS